MQLADTSAWWVSRRPDAKAARESFDELVRRSRLAVCDVAR